MPHGKRVHCFPLARKQKYICLLLFPFFSPHGTRHSYCSSPRAPGCPLLLSSGSGLSKGGQARPRNQELPKFSGLGEPRSSPGSQAPCPEQRSGPDTQYQIPGHRSHPCCFRDSEMPRDDFPIASSRTAKHVLGRDTHVGDAAGAGGGHSRGMLVWGDTAGGVHGGRIPPAPPSPCVAAPWAGSLPPSPEPSRQPLGWSQNALFPSSCH